MKTYKAEEVKTGYQSEGYRIDKTASPMNWYTQWEINSNGKWTNPKPVCFHVLPEDGWITVEKFDWNNNDSTNQV